MNYVINKQEMINQSNEAEDSSPQNKYHLLLFRR